MTKFNLNETVYYNRTKYIISGIRTFPNTEPVYTIRYDKLDGTHYNLCVQENELSTREEYLEESISYLLTQIEKFNKELDIIRADQ